MLCIPEVSGDRPTELIAFRSSRPILKSSKHRHLSSSIQMRSWALVVTLLLVRFTFNSMNLMFLTLAFSVLQRQHFRGHLRVYYALHVVANFFPWLPIGLFVVFVSLEPAPAFA
jgi:hypothetical protein